MKESAVMGWRLGWGVTDHDSRRPGEGVKESATMGWRLGCGVTDHDLRRAGEGVKELDSGRGGRPDNATEFMPDAQAVSCLQLHAISLIV